MSDEVELVACANCSSEYSPDDLVHTPSGDVLCEDCRIYCERCEDYRYEDNSRYIEGIGAYCENCCDNYTFWCESCESTYSDNHSSYEVADIGVYWCENCCSDNANWCENCDQYNRDDCDNCDDNTDLVLDYSWKPDRFIHRGLDNNKLFFGLELEMEISNDRQEYLNASAYVADRLDKDWIYLKRDSSIGHNDGVSVGPDGFELVSHPASFQYWSEHSQKLWDTLDGLRTKHRARAWNAKSNCGIHIHISRTGFKSGAHTHRFLSLVYKNAKYMKRFAGRDCGKYATFTDVWKYDEDNTPYMSFVDKLEKRHYSERMSAVNTLNQHTIELRFFRGTTQPKGVLATIELAHAMVEYTRDLTLSDVKLGMLGWEWFVDYIQVNNGLYPNAYDRIPKLSKVDIYYPELLNA